MTVETQSQVEAPKTTMRQRIVAAGVAEGLSIAEAGRQAGVNHRQSAHEMFHSLRERLITNFDEVGVTPRALALKIKEKLSAQETRLFAKDGVVTDAVDLEAHSVQLHAVELAADLMGLRQTTNDDAIAGNINVQIVHIGQVNAQVNESLPQSNSKVKVTRKRRARLPVFKG